MYISRNITKLFCFFVFGSLGVQYFVFIHDQSESVLNTDPKCCYQKKKKKTWIQSVFHVLYCFIK